MAASLPNEPDDLLITDELRHRIAHKADYQREKLAIQDLARQMAEQPDQVLPRLVHLAMELCGGQSAGISLYEAQPPGPGIFRWHHLAGRYANFLGGTTPGDFSPERCVSCPGSSNPYGSAGACVRFSIRGRHSQLRSPACTALWWPTRSIGHALGYFTRRGNSFRQRRRAGDNRARSVCRPCSQDGSKTRP